MAASFEETEKKFEETFGFIESDLKRILTLHPGVNYAAALLVACACDTLAEYKHGPGQGEKVFRKLLPDGPYRKVAKPIYDALRNGFAHRYNGYDILFDGQALRLAISWGGHEHLSIIKIGDIPNLVLNVGQLCRELFSVFDEYKDQLKKSGPARKSFLDRYGKEDKEVTDCNQIRALQKIVNHAPEAEA